ncbi:hypothetical protein C5167_042686 [Papaver somniferum]|uniref:Uncharacterized protein n=1 Tax=Papaver somniferum TaxID=3469 RepID=A0A4Y7L6V5_PAPSO|nr:hypothetical protein C5167_042686 [Papaver somniferum]
MVKLCSYETFLFLLSSMYNMEVLRDPEAKFQPLFRVTSDDGEQFKGSSPSACWNKIYKRSRKLQGDLPNDLVYSQDHWKLLCSTRGVSYGACIQLADEDRLHLISFDEDEEEGTGRAEVLAATSVKRCGLPGGCRPVCAVWKDPDEQCLPT